MCNWIALQSRKDFMFALILCLLERGSGLTLGPDSDGLLNFCDPKEDQTPQQREVEAGKQRIDEKGKQPMTQPETEEEPSDSSRQSSPEEVRSPSPSECCLDWSTMCKAKSGTILSTCILISVCDRHMHGITAADMT